MALSICATENEPENEALAVLPPEASTPTLMPMAVCSPTLSARTARASTSDTVPPVIAACVVLSISPYATAPAIAPLNLLLGALDRVMAAAPLALASSAELIACTVVSCVPPGTRARTVAPSSVARVDCRAMFTAALPEIDRPNFGCGLLPPAAACASAVDDAGAEALEAIAVPPVDAEAASGLAPAALPISLSSPGTWLVKLLALSVSCCFLVLTESLSLSRKPGSPFSLGLFGSSFCATAPATEMATDRPLVSACTPSASVAMKPSTVAGAVCAAPVAVAASLLLSPM